MHAANSSLPSLCVRTFQAKIYKIYYAERLCRYFSRTHIQFGQGYENGTEDLKLPLLVVLDLGKGTKKTLYISVECRKIVALPADQAYCKY